MLIALSVVWAAPTVDMIYMQAYSRPLALVEEHYGGIDLPTSTDTAEGKKSITGGSNELQERHSGVGRNLQQKSGSRVSDILR
jgi:hypothetical protein